MITEYDVALAVEGCRRLSVAIGDALKHPLPDRMVNRLTALRTEVNDAIKDFNDHKENNK